jgi:hypothetical protein
MAGERRAYVVRDVGTPSRLGKVYKIYRYTLPSLLEALDDARFRSYEGVPQVVILVEGKRRTIIRRYEAGKQVPVERLAVAVAQIGVALDDYGSESPRSVRKIRIFYPERTVVTLAPAALRQYQVNMTQRFPPSNTEIDSICAVIIPSEPAVCLPGER